MVSLKFPTDSLAGRLSEKATLTVIIGGNVKY